mmetsp:Transcript_75172/g.166015  ORF Transcript_75172/g.166015 Transcript_75172/m.166015 type:complete len:217 (-) Transcript_75172:283-933(-)
MSSGEMVDKPNMGQLVCHPSRKTPSIRSAKKSPCRVRRMGFSLMTTHPLGISQGSRRITVRRSFSRITRSVSAFGEKAGPARLRGRGDRKFSLVSKVVAFSDSPCCRITRICSMNACWSCFTCVMDSSEAISHCTPTRKGCSFSKTRPTANMLRKVLPSRFRLVWQQLVLPMFDKPINLHMRIMDRRFRRPDREMRQPGTSFKRNLQFCPKISSLL